jgi:hypothetical protein
MATWRCHIGSLAKRISRQPFQDADDGCERPKMEAIEGR